MSQIIYSLSELISNTNTGSLLIAPNFVIDCEVPEISLEADLVDIRVAPEMCLGSVYSCFGKIGTILVSQIGPHELPKSNYDFRVSYECSDHDECDVGFILENDRVVELFIDTFGKKRTFIGDWESNHTITSFGIYSPPDDFSEPMKMTERNRRSINERMCRS